MANALIPVTRNAGSVVINARSNADAIAHVERGVKLPDAPVNGGTWSATYRVTRVNGTLRTVAITFNLR